LPRNDGFIVAVVRDTKVIIKSDWESTHVKTSASQSREVVVRSNDDDRSAFMHDRNRFGTPDHGVTYRASKGTNCHGYEITIATVRVYVNEDGGMLSADTGELMAIQ